MTNLTHLTEHTDLTELTIVLGAPALARESFDDFQRRALIGENVTEHEWALHEYAALDTLTYRDGSVKSHTVLETMIGSVLGADVIVLDVDRRWVRAEDGQLYTSLSLCSQDIRARTDVPSLSAPAFLEALNAAAHTIASLDGREWIRWSTRPWHDGESAATTAQPIEQSAALVLQIAESVIGMTGDTESDRHGHAIDIAAELVQAIAHGRDAAGDESGALSTQLRALRFVDPLRTEWSHVTADALYVGALSLATVRSRITSDAAAGLAFLYLGKRRSDELRASEDITPRFRREIIAKTFMTSYALERLAPKLSGELLAFMRGA